jgi:hypothetical protein
MRTATGKKLEDFISQEGLCIFNDGTDTYLHPVNGSYSAIDLTVTDPLALSLRQASALTFRFLFFFYFDEKNNLN